MTLRRLAPWLVAAFLAWYLACHLVAYALHLPPDVVIGACFQGIGFGIGCVVFLSLAYQIARR